MSSLPEFPLDVTLASPPPGPLAALPPAALPPAARIGMLRAHRLTGITLTLHPYEQRFAPALRKLRNLAHNRVNLAQASPITAAGQKAWAEGYFARNNDLCWIVLSPAGDFIGSVSLYDIDASAGSAETGRLVLDEGHARSTPVITECELMIQQLGFAWLGLERIFARIRPENVKMVTMHERLGFRPLGPDSIRGIAYLRLQVTPETATPGPHLRVLSHWKKRLSVQNP